MSSLWRLWSCDPRCTVWEANHPGDWICDPRSRVWMGSPKVRLWICDSRCRACEGVTLEPMFVWLQVEGLGNDDTPETVNMWPHYRVLEGVTLAPKIMGHYVKCLGGVVTLRLWKWDPRYRFWELGPTWVPRGRFTGRWGHPEDRNVMPGMGSWGWGHPGGWGLVTQGTGVGSGSPYRLWMWIPDAWYGKWETVDIWH